MHDEMEYKRRSVVAKRESAMYKIIPNTINVIKNMKMGMEESANMYPDPSKETFLLYCWELWTSNSYQEIYWNTDNVDDGIVTMEELKELNKKKRMAKIT
jgi:hypothetical protein